MTAMALATLVALAGCSTTDDDLPEEGLQLVRQGEPTGTITINNTFNFTIGVVTFMDCNSRAYTKPQPQVIEPGGSATYTVSAGCYQVVSGEAGLSFNYATDTVVRIAGGTHVVLPQ